MKKKSARHNIGGGMLLPAYRFRLGSPRHWRSMKLPIACLIATTFSVLTFLAIFGLTAVVYRNFWPQSSERALDRPGETIVADSFSLEQLPAETDEGQSPTIAKIEMPQFGESARPKEDIISANHRAASDPGRTLLAQLASSTESWGPSHLDSREATSDDSPPVYGQDQQDAGLERRPGLKSRSVPTALEAVNEPTAHRPLTTFPDETEGYLDVSSDRSPRQVEEVSESTSLRDQQWLESLGARKSTPKASQKETVADDRPDSIDWSKIDLPSSVDSGETDLDRPEFDEADTTGASLAAKIAEKDEELNDQLDSDHPKASPDEATDEMAAPPLSRDKSARGELLGEESSEEDSSVTTKTISDQSSVAPSTAPRQDDTLVPRPDKNQNEPSAKPPASKRESKSEIVGWPLPPTLLEDLTHLAEFQLTSEWSDAARLAYETLNDLELTDEQSAAWIEYTDQLADQLSENAARLFQQHPDQGDSCAYLMEVAYRMERRAQIWAQVHRLARQNLVGGFPADSTVVASQIAMRTEEIQYDEIDPLWAEFLMLDRAQEIFAEKSSSVVKRQAIAQKILARVTSVSLSEEQKTYAQNLIGNNLGATLRQEATGQLKLGQFLNDLERHEAKPTSGSNARLNRHFQKYWWNHNQDIQDLSHLLDDHYRGPNVRLEISQTLLNRMVPQQATTHHQPVRDRILGANVFGQSRVTNRIQVQLVPDPNHLSFRLISNGRVLSNTQAHARGFEFKNLGNALVNASKVVAIGEEGVSMLPTHVRADANDRLTGIESQLDHVPIVGWMARRIALQQRESQSYQAKQIVQSRIQNQFQVRVDSEVQQNIEKARQWITDHILDPLHAMELEPTVKQLATTENEAIIQYRLASMDQNAADTPHPVSPVNSLASFQMHRSAVNNMLNRIHIDGEEFTPRGFLEHVGRLLGREDLELAHEPTAEVRFKFASRDPIQLDFQDGHVAISLRIRQFEIGNHSRWKNLIVKARYRPRIRSNHVYMTFDEEFDLRVTGYRLKMADQLAVRTVFATVFQPTFDFPLVPPEIENHHAYQGLTVSSLALANGWLAIGFNTAPAQAGSTPGPSFSNPAQPVNAGQSYQNQRPTMRHPVRQGWNMYRRDWR